MSAAYLLVLVFIVAVTLPLELLLGVRVYRRPLRWVLTLLPVLAVFVTWDVLAARAGHWSYDWAHVIGVHFGPLPLEEVLFFLVVPTASILALEAVRKVRGWRVDARDEEHP